MIPDGVDPALQMLADHQGRFRADLSFGARLIPRRAIIETTPAVEAVASSNADRL